jgi:hypothetical protein
MRHLNLLMAVCAGLTVVACDSDSPVQPDSPGPGPALFSRDLGSGISASAVSSSEIDLTWQQQSSPQLTGFQVFRSTTGATGSYSLIASTSSTVTSYADVGLTAGTSYCYEVRSYKTNGRNTSYSAYSEASCARTKLDPPTQVDAKPQGSTTVAVAWTWGVGTVSGFRVERSASSAGPWEPAATTLGSARAYVDVGRQSEKSVCYRVIALSTEGESGPSNGDCTKPPAGPTDLVAASASDGIELTWKDNSAVEFGYVLDVSSDGVTFTILAALPANTTGFHQPGVSSSTRYWYRLVATRDGGVSDFSNTASSTGGCVATSDAEVCGNGLDDNCDGLVDLADPACGEEPVDCNFNPCGSGTICNGTYCVSSCPDGYKDSDESDVDCGGGCANKCQVDQQCWGNWDCASNNCVYTPGAFQGVCQPPVSQP